MIIKHITDNDLYKFTTMNAIQKLYPNIIVRYEFINRGNTSFPEGFDEKLEAEIVKMANLVLTKKEEEFIRKTCYYFDPVFLDLLKGYRYDPEEVKVTLKNGDLSVLIEGYWYRTVLWEVPLMAIISELYYRETGQYPTNIEEHACQKAREFHSINAEFSDFGTRRRFSFDVHDQVLGVLKANSADCLKGTSNIYLAMKHHLIPIGTHPHEWFMVHAGLFGYLVANEKALEAWVDVYQGNLGVALTDTFTTPSFFNSFGTKHAKLFDGIRWDSGDPFVFTDQAIDFYHKKRINPKSKTVVYSDALNIGKVKKIKEYVDFRIHDVYGIGTYLTNDVGVDPLNIVIKITEVKDKSTGEFVPVIKLSDVKGKYTGDGQEIERCKKILRIS